MPATLTQIVDNIDWASFWQAFKEYADWDLEWYDGSQWVSVKEELTVNKSFPLANHCKFSLIFNAQHSGSYRLTFAIKKRAVEHIESIDKFQYELWFEDVTLIFDWSDCKGISGLQFSHGVQDGYFWFRIRRDNVPLGAHLEIDPATIATTTSSHAGRVVFQRKAFYANGRFWVFWANGTYIVYSTSTDGTSWTTPTTIRVAAASYMFSIFFDGTYLHYAVYPSTSANYALYYRRGTPNSDGTITWSAAEQTAVAAQSGKYYLYPSIAVDSDGYPFITYIYYDGTYRYPYITKSSTNDGTWTTASGFPVQLSTTANPDYAASVCPLTSGRMYVVYGYTDTTIKGKLWDGSSFGSEETCTSSTVKHMNLHSIVNEGDHVHLVFLKASTYDIIHVKRTYGSGWGNETTVQASTTADNSGPCLSIDANNVLYCFWQNSPSTDHVYYKKCIGGTWDSSPTDWINEEADDLTKFYSSYNCFYKAYGGYIGHVYLTKTASPYNIRFAYLTISAGQLYEISADAVTQNLSSLTSETTYNIAKNADVANQSLHASESTFNLIEDILCQAFTQLASETTFNISKDSNVNVLAAVLVEVVTGIIEIFKDAITAAQAIATSETTFNISKGSLAQTLASTLFELGIAKDATVKALAAGTYEIMFTLPVSAVVSASSLSALMSTFNISPTANVQIQAEVSVIKEGEVKVTRLFLVLGDLAIQLTGG